MLPFAAVLLALQGPVVSDTSPFRALPLPAPNRVRGPSGAPGPDYWQQRADYVIRATLDTAGSLLHGTERIHYENHSPDTLRFVWAQIEQNIFSKNSVTYALNQPPLHFAGGAVFDFTGKGFIGGITIERFRSAGRELRRTEYGTMMRVELPRPLAPRGMIDCDVAWHFSVPPYGGGRMGRIGTRLYEIGQWYPRMVVYDDVHGWNPLPYIGAGEFYLEYGDFDVTLTLPAGFVVAATGTVQNPLAVWVPATRARLARARRPSERRAVGRGEPDGVVHHQALQRDVGDVPVAARDHGRRARRGDGVSHADVRARHRKARGSVLGSDARIRPRVVSDDGRLGRAPLSLDGRGVRQLQRLRLGRGLLQGHGVRRYGAAGAPHRIRGLGRPWERAAPDHEPGRVARSGLDRVPEARADAHGAAGRGPGKGDIRAGAARVRAALDVQASAARGLLPDHRECIGTKPRLVLARLGVHHGPPRPGGRFRRHRG